MNPIICWMSLLNLSTPGTRGQACHRGPSRRQAGPTEPGVPTPGSSGSSPQLGRGPETEPRGLGGLGRHVADAEQGEDTLEDRATLHKPPRFVRKRGARAQVRLAPGYSLVALTPKPSSLPLLVLFLKMTTLHTHLLCAHVHTHTRMCVPAAIG